MSADLLAILKELDIAIIPMNKRRATMETCAINTLERIAATRGKENLRHTLMSIVETKNHKRELVAPIIWAISDILDAHPAWFCGEKWFAAIDAVDLAALHAEAKANRKAVPPRYGISSVLFSRLRRDFEPNNQESML